VSFRAAALTALCSTVTGAPAAAAIATHASPPITACSSSIVFGAPEWHARTLVFRATIAIDCPLGLAFSATLRSPGGCELASDSGQQLRYELFADPAMRSPIVACDGATTPLRGTGRRTFVAYGRVDGPVGAIGRFHDALETSITP
jgi:hypothetical protein